MRLWAGLWVVTPPVPVIQPTALCFGGFGPTILSSMTNSIWPKRSHFWVIFTVIEDVAVGVLLTGMGRDGAAGLAALRRSGAATLAQDEATSAVWGMPGAAAHLGAVDQELPLEAIAAAVVAAVRRLVPVGAGGAA